MNPLLIENGRLVDPSQQIDRVARVLVTDGKVAVIDPSDGDLPHDCQRIDASDRIVAFSVAAWMARRTVAIGSTVSAEGWTTTTGTYSQVW